VNGVSGGNLGSSGYTFARGKYLFSTADNVGALGVQGSFSIFDVSKVSTTSAPVLVGQIVSPALLYAEGLWVDPACSYAVVCVMGGDPPSSEQIANASVKVIAVAACIAAYEAQTTAVEPTVAATLTDPVKLSSPENLLVVETTAGTFGYVSNAFSSGTNDYTVVNLSVLTAPVLGISISNAALAGAIYAVNLGTTIYCTSRCGFPVADSTSFLTALDITTPGAPAVAGIPLDCSPSWLTGIDVGYYPDLDKTFAFVARTEANGIVVADVTDVAAMRIVATLSDPTSFNQPSNVHKVGSILFTTAYGVPSGITEVDVSNPYIPLLGSFTSTTALGLSGSQQFDHLFIGPGTRGYQSDTSPTGGVYVLQLGESAVSAGGAGSVGPAGPQGVAGTAGATGPTGETGPEGPTGAVGLAGATGATGTAGVGVPAGGTTSQVLTKNSGADYDTKWATPSGGSGGGAQIAGDLGGTTTTPQVVGLRGVPVSATAPSVDAQTLVYNKAASTWEPHMLAAGEAILQSGILKALTIACGISVTSGSLLVVAGGYEGGSNASTCADTLGTIYTQANVVLNGGRTAVFYGVAIASGANTITVTMAGAAYVRIAYMEVAGTWTTLDASATSTTGSCNITTTAYGDFLFAAISGYSSSGNPQANFPLAQVAFTNGSDCMALACYVVGKARMRTFSFTPNDGNPSLVLAAFK